MLTDQVHRHIPLATITDGVTEHEVGGPVVDWELASLHHDLKEMVRTLELIPEMDMAIELEFLYI